MTAGFTITSLGSVLTAKSAAVVRGVTGAANLVAKTIALIPTIVRAYLNRGPVLRMLEMDDRMLRDIGLTRADITCSLAGSLASDPSTRLRIYAVERRAGIRAQARERLEDAKKLKEAEQLLLPLGLASNTLEVK